jgi:hypothetical protein
VTPNPSVDICVAVATDKVRKRRASLRASRRRISPCLTGARPLLGNTGVTFEEPQSQPLHASSLFGIRGSNWLDSGLDDVRWEFATRVSVPDWFSLSGLCYFAQRTAAWEVFFASKVRAG